MVRIRAFVISSVKCPVPDIRMSPGYTGGHAWTTNAEGDQPSSSYMYKLNDTANNLAIDIHEYLDYDFR